MRCVAKVDTSSVTCEIKLNKFPENIYYNGEEMKGIVALILSRPQLILGVYVKLMESAHCEFLIGKDYNAHYLHKGDERIAMGQKYLLGCSGSTTTLLVRPGTYLYEFQFDIPLEIPSSIKTENGYVQYFVQVCIHYSSLPQQEFIHCFTVRKKFDLNIFPILRKSYSREKSMTFYDFCCIGFCMQTDPLTISAHIPVTGYVPGEKIITTLNIKNQSVDMQQFLIQIVKIIDLYAINTGIKKVRAEIVVAEKRVAGVRVGQYQTFNNYVTVPADSPSTDLTSSKICKIQYVLRIVGISNACCIKLPKFEIPIIIGTESLNTIPLLSTVVAVQQPEPSEVIVNQPLPCAPLIPLNQEEDYASDDNSLNVQSFAAQQFEPSIIVRQPMSSTQIRYNYEDELISDLPTYEEAMRLPTQFRAHTLLSIQAEAGNT